MEHRVSIVGRDYHNNGGTQLTIAYKGFKLRAVLSQDDPYENPFEESLGDVVAIYHINTTPDDYDTEDDFLEYEDVPLTFPMLYAGGVLIPFDIYADSTTHALIDPLQSYENAKQVWGYTGTCEEFIAYIHECVDKYTQYYHGYWHYVHVHMTLLDDSGEPVGGYEDSCHGCRSYIFEPYNKEHEHGLDALADMAYALCSDYARKGNWKQQLLIPLEGL